MFNGESLISLLRVALWPLIVLTIVIVFRGPLAELLVKLTRLRLTAGKLKLDALLSERVSAEVLAQVKRQPKLIPSHPELRTVTILYSETRGYTGISEHLSPENVAKLIRPYLTKMTKAIFDAGGTLDRYEGTAFTAYWGAPIPYDDSASRACKAALAMLEVVRGLSLKAQEKGSPPLLPIFAITTSSVMVGDFGSQQRSNYGVLGNHNSILRGLVQLNNNYQTSILITEQTHLAIASFFETRLLGEKLRVKGYEAPISVYELIKAKSA